jgi:hypothetical protein
VSEREREKDWNSFSFERTDMQANQIGDEFKAQMFAVVLNNSHLDKFLVSRCGVSRTSEQQIESLVEMSQRQRLWWAIANCTDAVSIAMAHRAQYQATSNALSMLPMPIADEIMPHILIN